MPTCKLYRIGNGYRYFMYRLKLSNIFVLASTGGHFIKRGWGWGGVGASVGRIGALAHCPTFTYGPPLCPVYMHTLYTHACFIRCKSLANEFALSLTENKRNSNIF